MSDPDVLAMIRDAEPGATVELPAGEHVLAGELRIERPLTLAGAGKGKTTLAGRHGDSVLVVAADGDVTVEGMTFHWRGEGRGDVVRCSAGRLVLRGCHLAGARNDDDDGGLAIRVSEGAEVSLDRCSTADNSFGGLGAGDGSAVRASRCRFEGGVVGAFAVAESSLELKDCEVRDTAGNALYAGDGSPTVRIGSSRFEGCNQALCADAGEIHAEGCEFVRSAGVGVYLFGTVRADIEDCTFERNVQHGLLAIGQVSAQLSGNTSKDNGGCGLVLRESSSGVLRNNGCSGHATQLGILVDGDGLWELVGNACIRNVHGIQVGGSATVELADNICEANSGGGVWFGERCQGAARDNTAIHNEGSGFTVTDAAAVTLEGNSADDNGAHGIAFLAEATGSATGNRCRRNGEEPIWTPGDDRPMAPGRPDAAPAPAAGDPEALVDRLDRCFAQRRPDYLASLRPGVSDAAVSAAEEGLTAPLPPVLRALFLWRDGEPTGAQEAFRQEYRLLSLDEALRAKAVLDVLLDAGEFEYADWWHPHWFPFLDNGAGDLLCVDLDGSFGGYPGQVLEFWHDMEERPIVAPHLEAWLTAFLDGIDADLWVLEDDAYDPRDEDALHAFEAERLPGYPIETFARFPVPAGIDLGDNDCED